jgi:hypothetical protein
MLRQLTALTATSLPSYLSFVTPLKVDRKVDRFNQEVTRITPLFDDSLQSIFSVNKWLGIAAIAYSIGVVIEGLGAAHQLLHSTPELVRGSEDSPLPSAKPLIERWQVFTAIALVSICGGFSWPCRLIHRSLKESKDCQDN